MAPRTRAQARDPELAGVLARYRKAGRARVKAREELEEVKRELQRARLAGDDTAAKEAELGERYARRGLWHAIDVAVKAKGNVVNARRSRSAWAPKGLCSWCVEVLDLGTYAGSEPAAVATWECHCGRVVCEEHSGEFRHTQCEWCEEEEMREEMGGSDHDSDASDDDE